MTNERGEMGMQAGNDVKENLRGMSAEELSHWDKCCDDALTCIQAVSGGMLPDGAIVRRLHNRRELIRLEFLRRRKQSIGASDAPVIAGLSW
jgi:hypothetical protein